MGMSLISRRVKKHIQSINLERDINLARQKYEEGMYNDSFDIFEQLADSFPLESVEILAEVYDKYKLLPRKSRWDLYQSRLFDFEIRKGDKVLDIGSGHNPFPLATHLADISLSDHSYGRAGVPFKHIDNKPVYEFAVENIPFADKEFDFVYCSHVLEHSVDPQRACEELMRVAKRGYIETPSRAKDLWLNSAIISNHKWNLRIENDVLVFDEYDENEAKGLQNDILMSMHVEPQTKREKAFSALIYLKADFMNTMMIWENNIAYKIRSKKKFFNPDIPHDSSKASAKINDNSSNLNVNTSRKEEVKTEKKLKFLQVHTFYSAYLDNFYSRYSISGMKYREHLNTLLSDGFSSVHLIAPYMSGYNYDSKIIIANDLRLQSKWLNEADNRNQFNGQLIDLLKMQIEEERPDVLYLSDPITFDSRFIRKLNYKPSMIVGWRAADIPEGTDWSEFDLILTGLSRMLEIAKELGAKKGEYFFPGCPKLDSVNAQLKDRTNDLVFCGSWTSDQHTKRNDYLLHLAEYCIRHNDPFRFKLFLSGEIEKLNPAVRKYNNPSIFGNQMYQVLSNSKITFDSRGEIRHKKSTGGIHGFEDIAKEESINMRIFEATGCGSLLIAEEQKNIHKYFEPGKEIVLFNGKKDLIDQIKYYLSHEDERQEIANNGHLRCVNEYSLEKRAGELDKIIRNNMEEKKWASEKPFQVNLQSDYQIINEIHELLNKKDLKNSFARIIEAKKQNRKIENLDALRGIYFILTKDLSSAKQSLLEELVLFPNNSVAKRLLAEIENGNSEAISVFDQEFEELYVSISQYTMLGKERLYNLFINSKRICQENIPGDFIECGVARGGSSALLALIIKKYSVSQRKLYSLDTFEGMPQPSQEDIHEGIPADETGWGSGTCTGTVENLLNLSEKLGVQDIIVPVKGLFQDTLPELSKKIGRISFLHMDGDWYESTKAILENVYDNVVSEGFIQVDDYGHWEGCRKAVDEYFKKHSISVKINQIDATGVWFQKPAEGIQNNRRPLRMVNIGCGSRFHKNWLNMDVVPLDESVKQIDIMRGIPMEAESADVIYHSHLLEHLPKHMAPGFISECYRVLRKGGVMRVVVPDLEQIARLYIEYMEKALGNDKKAEARYDWIMLEMFDQTVRNYSGGEMLKYWQREIIPEEGFIIERAGSEAKSVIDSVRKNGSRGNTGTVETDPGKIGAFRLSGEVHQWMYDRYSLGRLLKDAGFNNIKVCKADESRIPGFNAYLLDIEADGSVRKPDSLFMEAIK
jgi:predicted SAM-dependent methyltransferase/glycosyltransferase involved in cell wall biosynthesis